MVIKTPNKKCSSCSNILFPIKGDKDGKSAGMVLTTESGNKRQLIWFECLNCGLVCLYRV